MLHGRRKNFSRGGWH